MVRNNNDIRNSLNTNNVKNVNLKLNNRNSNNIIANSQQFFSNYYVGED